MPSNIACGVCKVRSPLFPDLLAADKAMRAKGWKFVDDRQWKCVKCQPPRDITQDKAHVLAGMMGLRAAGWDNKAILDFCGKTLEGKR